MLVGSPFKFFILSLQIDELIKKENFLKSGNKKVIKKYNFIELDK